MGIFSHHEPCPRCGSRDNLARYNDGSAFCFGCRYYESPRLSSIHATSVVKKQPLALPDDFGHEFSQEVLTWCKQYDILVPELIFRDVGYSPSQNQLIFTFKVDGKIVLWQARNFRPHSKAKYITSENHNGILPIYPGSDIRGTARTRTLVITEDCISSLKIARWCDAMPALGATLTPNLLTPLRRFYDRLIVWLDSDKYHNACKIATQAKMVGFDARAFYSEDDPKCYDDVFLCQVIG